MLLWQGAFFFFYALGLIWIRGQANKGNFEAQSPWFNAVFKGPSCRCNFD